MSLFGDIISIVNDIADDTLGVEVDITFQAWVGQGGFGKPDYASPVTYRGIAIQQRKAVYTTEKQLVWTKAYVAFLFPVPPTTPNAGQVRQQPIDPRDIIKLPDGLTGPIVLSGGLLDGETGKPLYNEVYIGEL